MVEARTAASSNESAGLIAGFAAAILAVVLFSGFNLLSRLAATTTLTPLDLVALRLGVGGIALAPVVICRGLMGLTLPQALLLSASGGVAFALLAYCGLSLAPASHGGIMMHGCLSVWGLVSGYAILGEKPTARRLAGAAITSMGAGIVIAVGFASGDLGAVMGDGLMLAASFTWTVFGALARRWNVRPVDAAILVAPLSMLMFAPIFVLFADTSLWTAPVSDIVLQGLFQGLIIGVLSPIIYAFSVFRIGATRTAIIMAAVPGITMMSGVLFLGEAAQTTVLLGVAFVTAGMLTMFLGASVRRESIRR